MISKYADERVWKEVELYDDSYSIQTHEKLTPTQLKNIGDNLIKLGEQRGLEGCFLVVESTMEPYESYLGNPVMYVCGYRKLNEEELKAQKREQKINYMAAQKGITVYEARILMSLRERGKL